VSVVEVHHFSLVQVAPWRGGEALLAERLQAAGWPLPPLGAAWFGDAARMAMSVRPQRWLLLDEARRDTHHGSADFHAEIAHAVGDAGAVVDISAARHLWRLQGTAMRERLAAGCRLDLHPAVFPPARAAATLIAQVNALVIALPEGWMLLAPTSTARHFNEWLQRITV
jgi:sarcosine oxidase subunit gamma